MKTMGKRLVVLLVVVSMAAALTLTGCTGGSNNDQTSQGGSITDTISQLLEGDVNGQVGQEYATKWFTFTVNSMSTGTSFAGYTAGSGNKLVIANITITNTFGSAQPFGTYDWFVKGDGSTEEIWPLSPLNNTMMPDSFMVNDNETVTYDVVVEFPSDLKNPMFMYTEVDEKGSVFTTFKIAIK